MKITIKLSELLYFSAFFIWLVFNFVAQTNLVYKFPSIYRYRIIAMIVCIVILIAKLLLEKHTRRFLLIFLLTICLAITIAISTNKLFDGLTIISTIMLIVSVKNINFRNCLLYTSRCV